MYYTRNFYLQIHRFIEFYASVLA